MMTKDEIKALIAETMRSNNKKEITAQAIADIFYEVVDAMGESSGGTSDNSLVRQILVPEDGEYTAEQLANNAEIASLFYSDNFAGGVLVTFCGYPAYFSGIASSSDGYSIMFYVPFIGGELNEDGSLQFFPLVIGINDRGDIIGLE